MNTYDEQTEHRTCRDCGADFEIPAGERRFFETNDLRVPVRCATCRAIRRAERLAAGRAAAPSR